jgi:hypothetical protein
MYLNSLLNNPRGRMDLQGSSRSVTYTFKLVRESPKGRSTTPLPIDLHRDGDTSQLPSGVLAKQVQVTKGFVGDASQQVMIAAPGQLKA